MDVTQGKQTVSDEEVIEGIRGHPDPAFTTPELAEQFDMTVEGIRRRLNKLNEEGRLYKKKPTNRTIIWWVEPGYSVDV